MSFQTSYETIKVQIKYKIQMFKKKFDIKSFDIHLTFELWNLELDVYRLGFFERDLHSILRLSKGLGVRQDFSDRIDSTGGPNLIAPTRWGGAEKDAESMPCRPIT